MSDAILLELIRAMVDQIALGRLDQRTLRILLERPSPLGWGTEHSCYWRIGRR